MSNDFDSVDSSLVFDTPHKKPPTFLFTGAIICISLGTLVGLYGLHGINSAMIATDNSQYSFGFIGYLLCAVIPIVLFQLFISKHSFLSKNSKNEPYDNYAGLKIQNIFKKVLAFGLITAALSVWVFLQPIAERYA